MPRQGAFALSPNGCGCPKLCRGWSGCVSALLDEAVASGRFDDTWRHLSSGLSGRPGVPASRRSDARRLRIAAHQARCYASGTVALTDPTSDQAIQNATHKTTGSPAKLPVRQPRQRFRHPQARTRIATEYTDNLAKLRRSINSACARRAAPTVLVGEHLDDRRCDPCPDIRRSTVGGRSLWL